MGNHISEQLLLFLRSIALGMCLGLLYDLARALRRLGGRMWGGLLDAAFCITAAAAVFFFILAGDGELRIFAALGIAGGAVLFWCLLGGLLRPVWRFWVDLVLLPARATEKFLKKCGRRTKKGFSFCRNWVTMEFIKLRAARTGAEREGDEEMGGPSTGRKKPAQRKKKTKPSSRLTVIILAALLMGIGVQIYSMFGQLQAARAEEAVYAQKLSALQETNRQLQEDLDNSGSMDLIEDIARDQLGLTAPGEKVFHISR